jgi:DNA-binding CsgD family transcriptional regulator
VYLVHEILSLQLLDRFAEAENILREATANPRTAALPWVPYVQMWLDFTLGRIEAGQVGAHTVIRDAHAFGNRSFAFDAYVNLFTLQLYTGDLAGAEITLEERTVQVRPGDVVQDENTQMMRAWLLAARGDVPGALDIMRPKLRSALQEQAYWPWWPGTLPALARLGVGAADPGVLSDVTKIAAEAATRNPGISSYEGQAEHVRGLALGDVEVLRNADLLLRDSPRPALRAAVAEDLGRALIQRQARTEGIAHLDRAWTLYTELGFTAPAEQTRLLLSGLGVRRSQWGQRPARPDTGWDSLTPAERRVADLIGSGLTNRDTATALGVSANTVGTHVRAIFAKLGVKSRVQLSNALHERAAAEAETPAG